MYVRKLKGSADKISSMIRNTIKIIAILTKTLEWSPGPPIASMFEVIFFYEYPTPKLYTIKKFRKNIVR